MLFQSIENLSNGEWQVTAIFYTALQAVDAAIAKLGKQVADHSSRMELIQSDPTFVTIRKAYKELFDLSLNARYDAIAGDFLPDDFLHVNDLADQLLKPIDNWLEVTLGIKVQQIRLDV